MKMKQPHEKKYTDTKRINKLSKTTQQNTKESINFSEKINNSFIEIKRNLIDLKSRLVGQIKEQSIVETIKRIDYQAFIRSKAFIAICICMVAVVVGLGVNYQTTQAEIRHQQMLEEIKTYKVFVDGSYIGAVSDSQIIDQFIEGETNKLENEMQLEARIKNEIIYEEYYDAEVKAQDNLIVNNLQDMLEFQVRAVTIFVNNNPVINVLNEQDAQVVIDNVKDAYVSHEDNAKVMMAQINEQVEYRVEWSAAVENSIKDLESATAILLKGTDKEIKHVVESGENIGVIAKKNKVTVSEIMDANPQLKSRDDIIHPGDQLSLVVPEPIVNVEVVEEILETEEIAFETNNVKTNKMYTWESKVQTPGQHGEREVLYRIKKVNGQEVEREVISEKVLKEPVDQVVLKGTLGVPANGTGKLIWPTSGGKISSPYGGARRHSGVDIANPTGTPIYAADDGTVNFAGWNGGYGNLVRITNTSTMQTYYAHMSKINVKAGQAVKKGEVIGLVGSTGNSTGPHLHFEVRINGGTVNPLNYYSSK